MEAISHAGTAIGVLASDGVVLAAEKKMNSKLLEPSKSSEKMCGRRATPAAAAATGAQRGGAASRVPALPAAAPHSRETGARQGSLARIAPAGSPSGESRPRARKDTSLPLPPPRYKIRASAAHPLVSTLLSPPPQVHDRRPRGLCSGGHHGRRQHSHQPGAATRPLPTPFDAGFSQSPSPSLSSLNTQCPLPPSPLFFSNTPRLTPLPPRRPPHPSPLQCPPPLPATPPPPLSPRRACTLSGTYTTTRSPSRWSSWCSGCATRSRPTPSTEGCVRLGYRCCSRGGMRSTASSSIR